MTSQLEAHEMPLVKVFSSEFRFSIPDYQRPYSWTDEQAVQLLDDLEEALDREGDDPYFLGSVVLIKESGQPAADVVDGQQRLTTITILLATLRDLTPNPDLRNDLDAMIREPGSVLQGLEPEPRLRLRKRDADFFRTNVQELDAVQSLRGVKSDHAALTTDARRYVRDNAIALHARLVGWDEARRTALGQFIATRTYLVVVTTPNLGSAHRIFSVMNARGLDLDPADIFKSDVIGKIPEPRDEDYARRWEDAEESLGRPAFSDLFLHVRMIFSKVRARRELLREFPEQVLNGYLPDRPDVFVDDVLVPYAKAYAEIEDGSYSATSGAQAVNAWFTKLRQLDNNDWRPAALWALKHHGDDPAWLDAFLQRLDRLASSMFIRRVYTTPRVSRYAELLKELDQGAGIASPSLELSTEERSDTMARLSGEVYQVAKSRKYVLLRLDEALANKPGVTYQDRIITVEHVLPQNPAKESPWTAAFSPDERVQWTHRLANLVLLNTIKNPSASNFAFDVKKQKYFTGKNGVATFALTTQVLNTPVWTPAVLETRQADLLGVLRSHWDL